MLASLFDWWIAHGNEDMKPLNPRTRSYPRCLNFFPTTLRAGEVLCRRVIEGTGGRSGDRTRAR